MGRSSENPEQAGEKELGINEHVHTVWTYLTVFARAGAVVRRMERSDGWPPVPFGYFLSRVPKVGMTLGTLVHLSAAQYGGSRSTRASVDEGDVRLSELAARAARRYREGRGARLDAARRVVSR